MDIIDNLFKFFFQSQFLLNIEMKTNYHSNLTFLYALKYKNWNYQIHSYLRGIGMETKCSFLFLIFTYQTHP